MVARMRYALPGTSQLALLLSMRAAVLFMEALLVLIFYFMGRSEERRVGKEC